MSELPICLTVGSKRMTAGVFEEHETDTPMWKDIRCGKSTQFSRTLGHFQFLFPGKDYSSVAA